MRKLAKQIALFWSHDDTGYLVKYFHPNPRTGSKLNKVLGLDQKNSSPRTGSKLIQYSEYSYEMSFQIRKLGLDQISSPRSLFHSKAKPRNKENKR